MQASKNSRVDVLGAASTNAMACSKSLRERGQPRTPLAGHPPDHPLFAINDGFSKSPNVIPDHQIRARGQRQHECRRRPTAPFCPPPRYPPRVDDARSRLPTFHTDATSEQHISGMHQMSGRLEPPCEFSPGCDAPMTSRRAGRRGKNEHLRKICWQLRPPPERDPARR
jgi:hypothetical protein